MTRVFIYQIGQEWDGRTVEAFLKEGQGFSSRILTDMKKSPTGMLRNGRHIRSVDRLAQGDTLRVELPQAQGELLPSRIQVPVVYEDEDIVVFDKPAGMPCHPAKRYQSDTLANVYAARWLEQYGAQEGVPVFRPVNRLDRNTTGLVLAAKNPYAASQLGGQLQYRRRLKRGEAVEEGGRQQQIDKLYLAVASGNFSHSGGRIELPIRRLNERSTIRIVSQDGQYALSCYRVLSQGPEAALLQIQIKTGRTHQIRVHFSHIGHPLLGDDLYGGDRTLTQIQMLRCYQLSFVHPVSRKMLLLSRPFEPELWRVARAIGIPLGKVGELLEQPFTEPTEED